MSGEQDQDSQQDGDGAAVDLIPSAVDEKQQVEIKRRKQNYAAKRADFWRAVLGDPVGRQEIWDILGIQAHAFETKFGVAPAGVPDERATWVAHGEQMLGQRVFHSLQKIDFENTWLMLCEHGEGFERPAKGRK